MNIPEITPKSLKTEIDSGKSPLLVDVREPSEVEICRIDGATLIPLGTLTKRFGEIPKDQEVIVFCKAGGRSAQAVQFLISQGYKTVKNLTGGILRWIDDIDPSQSKY